MAQETPAKESPPPVHRMGRTERAITWALLLTTLALALLFTLGEGLIHREKTAGPAPVEVNSPPPVPMEPPALAALEAFFEAPDLASKAALVRDPGRVRPMMEDYHRVRRHPFPGMARVSAGHPALSDGTPLVLFEVEPFSGPRYPVAVAWDGHRFAVDWESLTAYGTIDWIEFVETQPAATHTLRVFVQDTAGSARIPGMPPGSATFRLSHRDDPQSLDAVAAASLAATLKPLVEKRRTPATLDIRWQPLGPGGTPVPEIVRLVAPKWSP